LHPLQAQKILWCLGERGEKKGREDRKKLSGISTNQKLDLANKWNSKERSETVRKRGGKKVLAKRMM